MTPDVLTGNRQFTSQMTTSDKKVEGASEPKNFTMKCGSCRRGYCLGQCIGARGQHRTGLNVFLLFVICTAKFVSPSRKYEVDKKPDNGGGAVKTASRLAARLPERQE